MTETTKTLRLTMTSEITITATALGTIGALKGAETPATIGALITSLVPQTKTAIDASVGSILGLNPQTTDGITIDVSISAVGGVLDVGAP
jgi:hypothetical protein